MSDIVLLDLDSPEFHSSLDGRRSSIVSSRADSNTPEKDEVPVHLFLSPVDSGSTPSSSSHSSKIRIREKKRKKSLQETSFTSVKNIQNVQKSKISSVPNKEYAETALSSPSHSQGYTSSESELSSVSKTKKFVDITTKQLPTLRTNKIHDFNTQDESRRIKIDDSGSGSKLLRLKCKEDRRPSAGDSSADTEFHKSMTSASELSYKERIRDRFNTMKERAVESLSRPHSRSQSKLKFLLMKQGGTKMEELLRQEEDEVTAAMERHEKMKLRWKQAIEASIEEHKTQEEESDFYSETQELPSKSESPPPEESMSPSNAESPEVEEDIKVLTSELLGIKEDWDMVEYVKAEMTNPKTIKAAEEKLFCPSTRTVSLEDKLEPGLTPRYIEREGLFVGTKIKIPGNMKNKMEQRLLKTPDGRKWFGIDGELISSTCPLKPLSMRPYIDEDSTENYELTFKPASFGDFNQRYMDLSGNLNYVLDVDITSVEFTHHPLFSREHVLTQRLKELFIKYKKRKEMDNLNRLNGRLAALRKTRDNIKNIFHGGGDNFDLRDKLQKYEDDIKEVRQMRYAEGLIDKQLTNRILMTWKDLTKLREDQGYQNTSVKLNIRKITPEDPKEEKRKWDSDIKKETREIFEEARKAYDDLVEEYKEKYENWSRSIQKKQIRAKEKVENEDSIERLSDTESGNDSDSEKESFVEEEPKPPQPIAVGDAKAEVLKKFKESFKWPGEPEIEFSISKTTNLDVSAYNNKEELRRSAVKRSMIYLKLFYNGKEVCRSKAYSLGQKFNVAIGQRFAIRILEWPESLMIEIHEESRSLTKNLLVSGIYLPFPDSFTTVQNSEITKHEFSSKVSVSYLHSGVGSGKKIIPCPDGSHYNNHPVCLYTSGIVACRVGWVDDNGKILAPPEKYWNTKREDPSMNLSEIIGLGGAFDLAKLKEWAEKSKLDPNDPHNSAFFHFLQNSISTEKTKPTYFRLNPQLEDFDFCKESTIDDNIRLKLLKLRDMGEPEFIDMKMVPLNEKQIHKDIFKNYEKRVSTSYTMTDVLITDPLDGHRAWGKKYLEQVQQKLLKMSRTSRQSKRYQDIITEETIPDIGTLGLTFMKWLQPKRPLRPVRKERKKVPPQNLSGQEIKIVVNVVRAFEVPVRKDVDSMSPSENIEGFSLVNVRPFVEISFQGMTARTTAAEGANPTWNQDLQIPIKNKNGSFTSGNLQTIKDTLYLHLYDEMVIDLIEDESARETNIHQRLERHWLASMEIPFATLYFNSRIEGTFKLYSPPVLLGYEREAHRRQFSGSTGQEPLLPQRDATYITLFVTVQPALNPPKPIREKMESSEMPVLEKHLEGWQQEIENMFPHRKVKTLVLDVTGKSVCVTRFIKPLSLPHFSNDDEVTPDMAARYVSMIPVITESTVFPGFFDIWLTSDQVLRLLSGDAEDHAILLCSYFLNLGLKAYVLLGSGIPHGLMAYVLVKEGERNNEYYVWDPTNGQKYNVDDSFCPLQKIYCLINDQNIWANIQAEEMPRRTKFDLTRRADWFPAFGKNILAPTGSVQPHSLEYRTTSRQAVEILQDKMEKKLRDNLMRWRKKSRTQWNRYCAATLRKLLPKLEISTWNLEQDNGPDHVLELHHILASHKMCGFPINMAYTNIDAVIEAVKATGVHCNETEGVEFALAVYIHPYPNDVLSVWVYVASLVRRR